MSTHAATATAADWIGSPASHDAGLGLQAWCCHILYKQAADCSLRRPMSTL